MSRATAVEQYVLEKVNAERAKTGAQPLAFDSNLNTAAELHSRWMLAADIFSHTGSGGSSAGTRMTAAGYVFSGGWARAENIAWVSTSSPAGFQDEADRLHTNLMNSTGHRVNILNGTYREIGIGFESGSFNGWDAGMLTQNFAKTTSNPFLTGVAFDDKDGDRHFDIGEEIAGATVTARSSGGQVFTTTTAPGGGYEFELAAGSYSVTFSASGFASKTASATIGAQNVKLDWIDPAASGGTTTAPPPPPPAPGTGGTNGADRLTGTSATDLLSGLGGDDVIFGQSGRDEIDGGIGNDVLYGGSNPDVLTGGAGADTFVFNTTLASTWGDEISDFNPAEDVIHLDNAVMKALTATGVLSSSAFHIGSAAHDTTDRIIYDPASGTLRYDADGTGSAAPLVIAELDPGLALTAADFFVI